MLCKYFQKSEFEKNVNFHIQYHDHQIIQQRFAKKHAAKSATILSPRQRSDMSLPHWTSLPGKLHEYVVYVILYSLSSGTGKAIHSHSS